MRSTRRVTSWVAGADDDDDIDIVVYDADRQVSVPPQPTQIKARHVSQPAGRRRTEPRLTSTTRRYRQVRARPSGARDRGRESAGATVTRATRPPSLSPVAECRAWQR